MQIFEFIIHFYISFRHMHSFHFECLKYFKNDHSKSVQPSHCNSFKDVQNTLIVYNGRQLFVSPLTFRCPETIIHTIVVVTWSLLYLTRLASCCLWIPTNHPTIQPTFTLRTCIYTQYCVDFAALVLFCQIQK